MLFFETSAKTAEHVNDSFMKITEELLKKRALNGNPKPTTKHGVNINNVNTSSQKKGCCGY